MSLHEPKIPIVIDDIKNINEFPFTRCAYFSIEHRTTFENWALHFRNDISLPVMLLGLTGIIIQPSEQMSRFESTEAFDALYERIENESGLFVGR